jgi:sterol desaturase/sphingolipid hydroxylase (fatty acid hydroxylase superfamily)
MEEARQLIGLLHLREIAQALAAAIMWLVGLGLGPDTAHQFAQAIQLERLARSTIYAFVLIGGMFAVFWPLERLTNSKRVAYAGRIFRQDLFYALFYQGGFYALWIWAALASAMESRLGLVKFSILAGLPAPVHWVLYWLSVDFITYWWHRWLHASKWLWDIHSVHHTQPEMSFVTAFRAHPLEQLFQNIAMVIPLLILGVPTTHWLPLMVVMNLFFGAQHSALHWDFGRAYGIIVSPRFHALHHSSDPRHHNRNFGKILSIWDYLFGTAVWDRYPERLGVDGMPAPQSLYAQLVAPFQLMAKRLRRNGALPVVPRP